MTNLKVLNGDAAEKFLKTSGAGTDVDPHIPQHLETNSAAIKTAVEAIQTAVEILDNIVAGSEAQVDVVSSALPTGAATAANQDTANTALAAIQAAVEVLDNAIAGTEMQVDVVTSALPSGAATAANQATIITAVQAIQTAAEILDNAISGNEMQVDVLTMPTVTVDSELTTADLDTGAGTDTRAVVGLVRAESGGGTLVGSANPLPVSAASLPLPSGAATAANQSTIIGHVDGIEGLLGTIDADTSALAGAVSGTEMQVDVVSSALPTGAATAANQSTMIGHVDGIETLLGTIDADTSALAGAVAGTEMQVDVVSSTLPSGAATAANQTTIIGHVDGIETLLTGIDADTDAIKTAVQLIDNAIAGSEMQVDVVASLPAGDNNIGNVDVVTLPALAAGTNNIGDVDVASLPNTILSVVSGTASTSGNNTLIAAPGASNYINIYGIFIQNETATETTALLTDGAGGSQIARHFGTNKGDGISREMPAGMRIRLTANTALVLNLSGANQHGYTIYYTTGTS